METGGRRLPNGYPGTTSVTNTERSGARAQSHRIVKLSSGHRASLWSSRAQKQSFGYRQKVWRRRLRSVL